MRYRGQGHELNVELPVRDYTDEDAATFQELFNLQYRKNYGRTIPKLDVEALTWTLVLSGGSAFDLGTANPRPEMAAPVRVRGSRQVFDAEIGQFVEAAMIRRGDMQPGACFAGPAVLVEDQTTTYVPSSFDGTVSSGGHLVLKQRHRPS